MTRRVLASVEEIASQVATEIGTRQGRSHQGHDRAVRGLTGSC